MFKVKIAKKIFHTFVKKNHILNRQPERSISMNRKIINDAKKYLERYDFYRKRIENRQIIKSVFNHDLGVDNQSEMQSYVDLIDATLKRLKKDEKDILIDVFLKRKHRNEFNYSQASFYRLLNKACCSLFYSLGVYIPN
ncbi:hypothetical protein F6J63_01240 [Mycoplasmoides gallisepticum]|nr:hypothetical protein HFMG94VAA_1925 [Mycoplasmoides gallisepticum VA94_7994-1-7P]AFP76608.1 hypothetical protein HFMG95NCA_1853 [Mycoplasmoides gallisepticum NC95_13295-2-2P]AFP77362.1 hypothetical protein HFMG96NCA_1850 [Mycoplasmoides gallisepticum NC96_1596-4-2P]AFP78133.1 hypothetical protein HFMG01NYA_1864 [Mycoplasmoides gallisepticum NY01_2001.047-5-1P]AFP78893.1 hypothetical protein HFMG01WIA_1799 [Mycoplasmoides gallisepticum WI01_2001.043-13-2P]AFP79639.1 hypothetical protein HFMG